MYSSVDGHLGCFMAIMNNAAVNMKDKYPEVELLDHMVVLF